MLLIILRVVYFLICAGAISTYVTNQDNSISWPMATFLGLLLLSQSVTLLDWLFKKKQIESISAVYFGLLIGVLLNNLLQPAIGPLMVTLHREYPFLADFIRGSIAIILPYVCISWLLQTKNDFRFVIPYVEFQRDLKGGRSLIVDSSSLIDGRIADVVATNIIDTELVVPDFVLKEVQAIADNSDKHRRMRGRRGLEVLTKLQEDPHVFVRMYSTADAPSDQSVDLRLISLAIEINAAIVTSDFNLNKVASVQGVTVINLNDVANSLKPRYIPGERFNILIMKEGEAYGQGIGYLDDGTMVVCENSNHLIGKATDVIVTSVLQNSSGRMIFGKPVFVAKSSSESSASNEKAVSSS